MVYQSGHTLKKFGKRYNQAAHANELCQSIDSVDQNPQEKFRLKIHGLTRERLQDDELPDIKFSHLFSTKIKRK